MLAQPSLVRDLNLMRRRTWAIYALLAGIAICTSLFLVKNTDLSVYWYAATGYFSGIRSAYGPDSGIGHPMEYRYPPVTYLIIYPLRLVSLRVAGFCWMVGAWAAAIATVSFAIRIRRFRFSRDAIFACCAFMLAYIVLAIRYGNVQPYVICALFSALILSERYPAWSGILLALGITFKIWPIFFLPWLFHRARRKAATYSMLWLAGLWIFPLFVFGAHVYWSLLQQWYTAMRHLGTDYSEFYYFPGQSLRAILLRYFTPVTPVLKDFPVIHVLSLPPRIAVTAWGISSLVVYCVATIYVLRSDVRKLWAWDGMAFVLYSVLEPYAVKSGLISLGPAALTAACLYTLGTQEAAEHRALGRAKCLFLGACLLSFLGAVIQYRPWQRYLLTAGLDFWAEILLLGAFLIWISRTRVPEALSQPPKPVKAEKREV